MDDYIEKRKSKKASVRDGIPSAYYDMHSALRLYDFLQPLQQAQRLPQRTPSSASPRARSARAIVLLLQNPTRTCCRRRLMVCTYNHSIDENRSLRDHVAEISAVWTAVKATAFATMKRQSAALPSPPAAAEQAASTSLPEPDVTPEVVPDAPARVKAKKSRKEKTAKSKPAVPEVPETVDTERVEHALSDSPATTSVTAVETQQTKQKAKSGAKTDARATEAHVDATDDVNMEEQATKLPEASESAIHASPQASPRPAPRALQDVQMSSPPRPPVGSDVDEVIIEEHGEGSSDESSSSDSNSDAEDEAEDKDKDHGVVLDLSLKDVEALLRGPTPKKSILEELPSDSEEEDEESDGEERSEPDDDEEEEIKLDKKYRRLSKRFQRETSSSDEEPEPEPEADPELVPEPEQEPDATQEEEEQEVVAATFMDVDPQQTLEDEVRLSFFQQFAYLGTHTAAQG